MSTRDLLLSAAKKLDAGERLTDDELGAWTRFNRERNLSKRWVPVQKLSLRPGEELMDFVDAMIAAVQTNRVVLGDGSLDVWIQGIFEDFVVVMDFNTGKLFKSKFERAESGEFTFEEPIEVRSTFVPVEQADDGEGGDVAKRATTSDFVDLSKSKSGFWGDVLKGRRV